MGRLGGSKLRNEGDAEPGVPVYPSLHRSINFYLIENMMDTTVMPDLYSALGISQGTLPIRLARRS